MMSDNDGQGQQKPHPVLRQWDSMGKPNGTTTGWNHQSSGRKGEELTCQFLPSPDSLFVQSWSHRDSATPQFWVVTWFLQAAVWQPSSMPPSRWQGASWERWEEPVPLRVSSVVPGQPSCYGFCAWPSC